eukprot:COSAG02_NODE_2664_length_8297_cov_22.601244_7_plen_76_part_00
MSCQYVLPDSVAACLLPTRAPRGRLPGSGGMRRAATRTYCTRDGPARAAALVRAIPTLEYRGKQAVPDMGAEGAA